jgi:hypothetical protein
MLGMNMKRLQQRQHRRAEKTVQKCGKSQLFHFWILLLSRLVIPRPYDSRRKAVYPSHTASAINPATGTHKPHRKPRKAVGELLNIA